MKKILCIFLLLVGSMGVFAAAPARVATDAGYEWVMCNTVSNAANADTLVSTDSSNVILDFIPEKGWEYIYVRDAVTGTGSDSAYYYFTVRAKTSVRGSILYSTNVDTIVAAAGEAILIPFGQTLFGVAYDIKLLAVSGSTGSQVILNRSYLYKRRAIASTRPWN